jgi:hypothetical protein
MSLDVLDRITVPGGAPSALGKVLTDDIGKD